MACTSNRYLCIHGHFYQPPRENPWLEEIEVQEAAYPFHDWNEKIADECYTPNSQARILDEAGRVRDVVNTYEHISFDFGPTLLSWLEKHAPDTYESILSADAISRTRRSGHGNAIAHAYNHMVMPLASSRDKLTQVLWGLQDFRKRFNRDPEGMWLPETAVDKETLGIMSENGIRFTILAPSQAGRFRGLSSEPWVTSNPGSVDPSRPYVYHLPSGRSIVLFFYDAPISHSIAFEQLLNNGEHFKERLLGAFSDTRTWPQLVHIATDGESYGHHHRFGEMALAYALEGLLRDPTVNLTNYGEFLDLHPPTAEAEFIENSAWSCAHGMGRWSEDCSCSVSQRPDWNQQWRKPLRRAMDLLRDRTDRLFEERGASLLQDHWASRNAYIQVVLNEHAAVDSFLNAHVVPGLPTDALELVLHLLEMQRNRMLMYTSCGWFFDDVTGIETIQVLRYAARVLQLMYPFDPDLIMDFLRELSHARSNVRPHPRADEIFRQRITPQITGLQRVAAHVAISLVFELAPASGRLSCYDISLLECSREESGGRTLITGVVSVRSRILIESKKFSFAVVHLGGVDLRCSMGEHLDQSALLGITQDLVRTFRAQSSTELVRKMDHYFPGRYFSLRDLFVDTRREIVGTLTDNMFQEQALLMEAFYRKNRDLAKLVVEQEEIVPVAFLAAARFVLNRTCTAELRKIASGLFPDDLETLLEEQRFWTIEPDLGAAAKVISNRILTLLRILESNVEDSELGTVRQDEMLSRTSDGDLRHQDPVPEIIRFLDLAANLDLPVQWGSAQVVFFRILKRVKVARRSAPPPLFLELASRLGVRVD
jgi:alpha-amylase/alpha-mannosidase (GH57 family)